MKKFLSIIILCFLICIFSINVFAQNYTVYGNVSEDTSQVKILLEAMLNDPAFDMMGDFEIARTGEYEYICLFNIDNNSTWTKYIYSAIQSGYNSQWQLQRVDSITDHFYNPSNYTVVANCIKHGFTTLGSQLYRQYCIEEYLKWSLPFIAILLGFYIFRVHKRSVGL